MKLITWNINGYRSITGQNPSKRYDVVTKENKLFDYIEKEDPDIICLQETKADIKQIKEELICPHGYHYVYNSATSKKGYSGVVVFSKKEAVNCNLILGKDDFDAEGRFIELDFGEFSVMNIYFPKGYEDNERLFYKLNFHDYINNYIEKYKNKALIISGDYNIAHKEIDLARPKENVGVSGFLPEERERLDQLVSLGFVDAFRQVNNEAGHYSWWSQRGRARENNVGWRIDYHFISQSLANSIKDVYYQPHALGSDHCPLVLELNNL